MSDKSLEQLINIKFCVKIGRSASEALALLTAAYGEYAMKKLSVFEWHRRFKEGRDVQDDPRSGQPIAQSTDASVDSSVQRPHKMYPHLTETRRSHNAYQVVNDRCLL